MVNKCGVCGKSGATKSFPANSLPHKQGMWMSYLNLAEEGDKLLIEWREKLGQKHRIYWCSSHFNGDHPDPIDLRPPTSSASNDISLLSRKMSEVRVTDNVGTSSVPPLSRRTTAEFPQTSHSNSFTFPSPTRDPSEISSINCISSQRTDITIHTVSREKYETMYNNHFDLPSSQDTTVSNGKVVDLPEYILVSSRQLLSLFGRCPTCGLQSINSINSIINGSAVAIKWECDLCLEQTWHSQPLLDGRYYEGNVKIACSAHTTGLPLARLDDFASEMGLAIPAQRTMHNYIADLIGPAVDNVYVNHMKEVQDIVRNTTHDKGIDISMDGRYDSPGFSASNCTISAVDLKTNLVIMVVNKNKKEKEIGGVSGRMEKEGVRQGLMRIQALQFKVHSLCTDNDARIGKMLREDAQFKDIKHLLDFWHLIKSINHDLREVPFLHGIKRCRHKALQTSPAHQIKRGSEEYHALKAIVMKRTFMAGFLRASPKKNTSPNECYNSIINLYAPKIRACSPKWYEERIKLTTLHFNTLALLNMLDMRVETGNCSVTVNGRQGDTVKRKMAKAKHEWRKQAWEEIPKVIERMRLQQFLKKNNAPSDRGYILGEGEDGAESDVSVELGGGLYGEPVDSDQEPLMDAIELSDAEDRESEEEEGSSGSEWEEGETGRIAMEKGGRGRGRGRGGRGRGLGRAQSRVTADTSTALTCTLSDEEEVQGCTEEGKGEQKKERREKEGAKGEAEEGAKGHERREEGRL